VRCIDGAVADPLSARAAIECLMGILFIIMFVMRAGALGRRASISGSETGDEIGLLDTYARALMLVLLCLLGLLALGLMYGNVLDVGRGL
jgi:hypothetical protein